MEFACRQPVQRAVAASVLLVSVMVPPALAAADTAVVKCFGQPVTMMGTDGPDRLVGLGDVADVIHGGGGDDYLLGGDFYDGGDASDLICGGPGDDHVMGSPGDDKVSGGPGDDEVDGGNGADLEYGNAGADRVGQGSFADADSANDVIMGGTGDDHLIGGWGRDKLYGQRGKDTLVDTECDGPTRLDGGPGEDALESWSSSFEGWHGNVCDQISDLVIGGGAADVAEVDERDRVRGVEDVTVITDPELPQG